MATLAELLRGGYKPPTTSALADPIKEHFRNLPQTLEANQRAMDKTMAGMDKTDIMGRPNPNYYPEAMQEFTQNYLPNFMGATAFHGTPHKILGKFDINKVGTGEGAQAYGHGMYFAEAPDVAKQYATDRSYVGKFMAGTPDKTPWEANRIAQDTLNVHGDNAIAQLESTLKANSQLKNPRQLEANKQLEDAIDILKTNQLQPTGNLYKVDIPDADIPNMLDWDKPFSEQSKTVQKSIVSDPLFNEYVNNIMGKPITSLSGKNIQKMRLGYEADLSKSTQDVSAKATNWFKNSGISGIRYLDEGSRGAGGGTSNFVVFDPSTVKILEENGIPTRKELIQQQIDKIE
jgi:hypothetical protein